MPIPIPPLAEQERIVAAIEEQLSRLDAGVALLERMRLNLRRMRAAVLDSAMSGSLCGMNSRDWDVASLGDILTDLHAGKSFKCEERPARPTEWGVIKVSAMTWGEFRQDENKTVLPDRSIDERLQIHRGDLLVSRANTLDYVGAVVHVRGCRPRLLLSDKSLRLVPQPGVLAEWIMFALRSHESRRYLESVATGTSDSMRNISQPKLKELRIPVPPADAQRQLVAEIQRHMSLIDQLISDATLMSKRVESLRSSILTAAFTGQLVDQDPTDEPAASLLERISAEYASVNGHKVIRIRARAPRTTRTKDPA